MRDGLGHPVLVRWRCEPELVLGLDQGDEVGITRTRHGLELRRGAGHRQVRQVHRHDLDEVGHHVRPEDAEIRALQRDDARILAQRAQQLAVPCIDGIDARGPGLEQHAGEPARRSAHVEGDAAGDGYRHRAQRVAQLRLAAQCHRALHGEGRARRHQRRRVAVRDAVDQHDAGHDGELRILEVRKSPRQLAHERAQPGALAGHEVLLSIGGCGDSRRRRTSGARCARSALDEAGHVGKATRAVGGA
jgi:hypothetical protein